MHPHDSLPLLTEALVQLLAREETLLREGLANAAAMYEALRRGDVPAALAAARQQGPLAASLASATSARAAHAAVLDGTLLLDGKEPTLTLLADQLPEPQATSLRDIRTRLLVVTSELSVIQARNANLLSHLRLFFRGVLAGILPPDVPLRYGPSGRRL
jgi:hypothetical protein